MEAESPVSRPASDRAQHATRPLRRKPKQLEEEPAVFEPASGGKGAVWRVQPGRPGAAAAAKPGGTAQGFTDETGELVLAVGDLAVDASVRLRARQIASRLAVAKPRRDMSARRGVGELTSVPYRGGSDDIDLDRTLAQLTEHPFPDDEDIIVRERLQTRRSVVLLVDVSGSMKGEQVKTAAATVGALAGELQHDALAVVAFWSDAAILLQLGQPVQPMALLDDMLKIPARGLTNVAFPLELAARQLAGVPPHEARVLLLSDCVHNAGPDPRPLAARLPRLDVLLDVSGEHDSELGKELARFGHGKARLVRGYRDVAPALSVLFRD